MTKYICGTSYLKVIFSAFTKILNLILYFFSKWWDFTVTSPPGGGQRSTLTHQRRDAHTLGQQRPLCFQTGRWWVGRVWECPGCCRWLWLAAPLREHPPSDDRAARENGAGNKLRTCRLLQTPALNRTGPSAITQGGGNSYAHTWSAPSYDSMQWVHIQRHTQTHTHFNVLVDKATRFPNYQHPLQVNTGITHTHTHMQTHLLTFCALLMLVSASNQAIWRKTSIMIFLNYVFRIWITPLLKLFKGRVSSIFLKKKQKQM